MTSSSNMQSILLLLFCISFIRVSQGDETEFSVSLNATSKASTCAVPQNKCASECNRRCSATAHLNNCLLFCNKCCNKCLCVPPGTYANKECCPCYNNLKTKEGGPKCP